MGKAKTLPYEGELKPCKLCGSDEVEYLCLGVWKRLGCRACDTWLEARPSLIEEEEDGGVTVH